MDIQSYDTEIDISTSITYSDNSKTELSLLRETKTFLISHYESDSDIPDKQIHLNPIETQALFKLLNSSPDISQLLDSTE